MPRFELQKLPGLPGVKGRFPDSKTVIDFLNEQKVHGNCVIRVNGRDIGDDFDINRRLKESDILQVYDQPRGGLFKGITNPFGASHLSNILLRPGIFEAQMSLKFGQKALSKVIGSLAKGGIPSVSTGESSNNDLTQQTNTARLYKARPNIYGQVRAFPDLIQESLLQYIDGVQYATEFMELGYGKYDVSSIRFAESTLTSMDGATYKIFQPGDIIPEMVQGYSFDDVSNQELEGEDSQTGDIVKSSTTTDIIDASYGGGEVKFVILKSDDFDYFNDSAKPLAITLTFNVSYSSPSGTVTKDVTLSGAIYQSDVVNVTDETTGAITSQNYEFYLNNLSGSDLNTLPSDTVINKTSVTFVRYSTLAAGPFFAPFAADQLWINVYVNLASGDDANVSVTYWLIDDENNQIPGTEKTVQYTLSNSKKSTEIVYQTIKITDIGTGRAAFTIRRVGNANDTQMNVKTALAVTIRENVTYPNDTIIRVDVKQTDTQASGERKYNCLAERYVIGYNRTTGQVDNTLRMSRSFADAVLHEWVVMSNQPAERLDLVSLYAIADSLSDEQLGYFDYTFSDATQSLGERLQIACNAANVSFNWIGDRLVFWRDEKVAYPSAVFSRSNMFWDNFSKAYSMSLKGGYDGVSVTYTDPSSNKAAYIYLSVTSEGITESSDETVNAKQITLNGCRNEAQARDRAYTEAGNMVYSRATMSVMVLESVQVVRGSVIQCPDMYDNEQQTGYLTGRDGNQFNTSEVIDFTAGPLLVVMTDSDGGYRGAWSCLAVDGNPKSFSCAADDFDINIYDGSGVQSPSRYFIATDSDLNSSLWRVDSAKPNGDNTQTLTLTEYSPDIYSN